MSRRAWWIAGFLAVTALAVGGELWAALDSSPNTVPWTDLLGDYVPWPVTAVAVALLVTWLPVHLYRRYRYPPKETALTLIPLQPTQTRHPWRATLRTVLAAAVALVPLLPEVAHTAHIEAVPPVARVLAVAAAVTRVLAIPGVDRFLARYVPWLAAAPKRADLPQ